MKEPHDRMLDAIDRMAKQLDEMRAAVMAAHPSAKPADRPARCRAAILRCLKRRDVVSMRDITRSTQQFTREERHLALESLVQNRVVAEHTVPTSTRPATTFSLRRTDERGAMA